MAMELPEGVSAGPRPGRKSVFHVVMAYDDFTSGKRAMDACNFLVFQLGDGVEWRSSMWKFDVLGHAKLNQIAIEDALEADVIIVANARNSGLPAEARKWIDGWVPGKRGQTAALVALLDFTGDQLTESAQAYAFLKEAATSADIDFLPQEIRFPENFVRVPRSAVKKDLRPAPEQPAGRRGPEGWGLND